MRFFSILGLSLVLSTGLFAADKDITDAQIISLVKKTVADIKANAPATLEKIKKSEHPYKDKDNPSLYAFVYTTDVTMVAHGDKHSLENSNYKGKPDMCGCNFRDEIVNGNGGSKCKKREGNWVFYIYTPSTASTEKGSQDKKTYVEKVKGSDGIEYVVSAGKSLGATKGCGK